MIHGSRLILEFRHAAFCGIKFACSLIPDLADFSENNLWTILGEWSTANTDCAQWLNGRGVGSRWDGTWFPQQGTPVLGSCAGLTGDSANFSSDYKSYLREYDSFMVMRRVILGRLSDNIASRYWEVQVNIGEAVQGWVYWTWKVRS